eukprot:165743-Rhodomonas_salina.5
MQDMVSIAQLSRDNAYVKYTSDPSANVTHSLLCFICQTRLQTLAPSKPNKIPRITNFTPLKQCVFTPSRKVHISKRRPSEDYERNKI